MSKDPLFAERVVETLRSVLGHSNKDIPLHEPRFGGNEWKYVKDCIDSTFVSSVGRYVDRFEAMVAEYTGVKRAVAVVNGTCGLHVGLELTGVHSGDEVLIPALTFVATANAVSFLGAVPHFVDSAETTLGVDPWKLDEYLKAIGKSDKNGCCNRFTGRRIKALMPVHTFGHPVDLDPLVETCAKYGLTLIEDATESLGSFYKGKHTGHWGKLAVLSFNGNKIVTTGGGGAILTNDEELGDLAKHITTTARTPHQWLFKHDMVAYNYRMPNVNAALGCAQLEQLPSFLEKKRDLAKRYADAFSGIRGIRFFREPEFARSNYWLNVLLVENGRAGLEAILEKTNRSGLMTRPAWTLMHKLPMYEKCPRMDLSVAESIEAKLVNIPSSAGI